MKSLRCLLFILALIIMISGCTTATHFNHSVDVGENAHLVVGASATNQAQPAIWRFENGVYTPVKIIKEN